MIYKGSFFFCQKLSSQVYLASTGLNFPQKIFSLTPFTIILKTTNCKNSHSCPEQKLKNPYTLNKSHIILNVDNFLDFISKSSPSFKFSSNFQLSLHLPPPPFSSSLFCYLLFLHCHVNVFSLCFFLDSLNYSQL